MLDYNEIYCGDNVELCKQLDDCCIDLTVTSPPYDNLRNYKGYSWDFEGLTRELYRVTKDGGVVVWVVRDAVINGSETGTSFRQALYFKDIGFNLHDTMIYAKNSYVPLNHKRYEQAFEYMFVFSKGKPKTFNAIKLECVTKGTKRYRGNEKQNEQNYSMKKVDKHTVVNDYKVSPNIFYYDVGKNDKTKHNAPFPEKLAEDHISSWSNEGDVVLDPFMGSGTTAKMAIKNNRKYIGFEISEEYCEIAKRRINDTK